MKQPVRVFFLLINFLLLSFFVCAQSDTGGRWSAGLVYSPGYSCRTLAFPESAKSSKNFFDKNDFSRFSYSAGISLLYRLNPALKLESGMLFSDKGYRYRSPEWKLQEENDPAVPIEGTTSCSYRYLEVPVKINYFFHQKKVSFFLSAGISADFLLGEVTVLEAVFRDRTEIHRFHGEDVDYKEVAFSISGGAGMDYLLSDRLTVRVNPEFRHSVTSVADTPGKIYFRAVGLNTGLYFKIKKGGNSSHP